MEDNSLDIIASKHPQLFKTLLDGKFIIESQAVEWEEVVKTWKREDTESDRFTLIINPTLKCNMKCWYCYESHKTEAVMKSDTLLSILRFISNKVTENGLKGLNVDFFGGEPLLYFKEIVKPILEHAYNECVNNNVQLYVSFTTNGYLLSNDIYKELIKYTEWEVVRLQITIDGNREFHNKTRALGGTKETYDVIVSHIKQFATKGFLILVRFNYTEKNISSFFDVIEDFASLPEQCKEHLNFSLQKVWQVEDTEKLDNEAKRLREALISEGFKCEPLVLTHNRCYADKDNTVVINYDGNIYKCTARDFSEETKEGILHRNGSLEWNKRSEIRAAVKYGKEICHSCQLFPLCNAGCSQNKMEDPRNVCTRNYSKDKIERLIRERIHSILE